MKKANAGFTLIELIVVIVILGILAAVAVPKFFDLSGEAETAAAQGVAGAIASASSINFAAKKVGSASAITLNAAVCDNTTLTPLMQGGIPTGYTVSATPAPAISTCAGTVEAASCTVTKGTKTATATILCAR